MAKHLVLVGGGHAHLTCLKMLHQIVERGHRVTLVSPAAYHYYSGMGPGMLAGTYTPQEIRFNIKNMAEKAGGSFLEDAVVRIEADRRLLTLASGREIAFDVASFNTGSGVPLGPLTVEAAAPVFPVKPIINLVQARRIIREQLQTGPQRLLVAGGGPAGLEVAANAWRLVQEAGGRAHITLLAGHRLMAKFPDKVRRLALASLGRRGIDVREGPHLKNLEDGQARLASGPPIPFDVAFLALGVKPAGLFTDSGLATGADGGLLVNQYLQAVDHPHLFGGGDCISFRDRPLDKVGVYAVRQNPILLHNLVAALEGWDLVSFRPQDSYLLIFNLGDGRGIFWKQNWVWDGRLAFILKNYIDRKFMEKFQVSGEAREPA